MSLLFLNEVYSSIMDNVFKIRCKNFKKTINDGWYACFIIIYMSVAALFPSECLEKKEVDKQ